MQLKKIAKEVFSVHLVPDGWTLARVIRHVLYWTFWIFLYGSLNFSHTTREMTEKNWYLLEFYLLFAKLPLVYIVAYWLIPKYFSKKKYVHFTIGLLLLAFISLIFVLKINALYPMPWQPTSFIVDKNGVTKFNSLCVFRYVDMVYTCFPMIFIKLLQRQIEQNSLHVKLINQRKEAELMSLKNQLQPHFLFNTLNNIYGQILTKDESAGDAVVKLSDILSYMLYDCEKEIVSLEDEVKNLKNYIQLEQMRYDQHNQVDFEVVGDLTNKYVTPLLLLPFVENAYKHGIGTIRENGWIKIYLEVGKEHLEFVVENNYKEQHNELNIVKSGIGLKNVKKRLSILYPEDHSLEVITDPTFLIHLKIRL